MPRHVKAVIVEDEELMRRVVKVVLEAVDCELVGEAADGEQGLQLIRETSPDLILMDIKMPVMDGIEVLRQLQAAEHDALVIMLTNVDEDSAIEECMILGAKDYLRKTMPVQDMVSRLERQIARLSDG